ncbi:MAG: hypothetical protein ABFR62_00765 [Bacteroidota bacterium]
MGIIGWSILSLAVGFVVGWLGRSAKKCVADEAVESLQFKLKSMHQELDACRAKCSELQEKTDVSA